MRDATSKASALATVVGILVLLVTGTAEAVVRNWKFGLVGVVFDAGQAVQVNSSHVGDPNEAPSPCSVLVEFVDGATGVVLKTVRLSVPSGRTQSADFGVTELVPVKGKVPIYARVSIGDPNTHPACTRPVLEVIDKASDRTAVTFTDPEIQPNPEAFFAALTLVTGQFLRLNAVSFQDPNLEPCPILLTIFAADGRVLAQQRPVVASHTGAFLDVGFQDPNERVLVRAAASRVVGGRTLCRAFVFSVEVYDAETGITTVIIGDPNT